MVTSPGGQGLDKQANPVEESSTGRSQEVTGSQRTGAEGPTVITGRVRSSGGSRGVSRGGARGAMKRAREQQRESMAQWLGSKPTTTLAKSAVGSDGKPQGSLEVAWQPGPVGPSGRGRPRRAKKEKEQSAEELKELEGGGWIDRT